jgi:hypothetical protein
MHVVRGDFQELMKGIHGSVPNLLHHVITSTSKSLAFALNFFLIITTCMAKLSKVYYIVFECLERILRSVVWFFRSYRNFIVNFRVEIDTKLPIVGDQKWVIWICSFNVPMAPGKTRSIVCSARNFFQFTVPGPEWWKVRFLYSMLSLWFFSIKPREHS